MEMQPKQLLYKDYRDSLVVLADVLGMSHEILAIDNETSFNPVAHVLQSLQEQANNWRKMNGDLQELQATAVSDTLIISIPLKSNLAATALILAMHSFQYSLLRYEVHLLRGYMAPGRLYHMDEYIFGEAFIRAWEGEQGLKNGPPRIVLDPKLAAYALKMGANKPPDDSRSAFEYLRQDPCDGLWFIDYLKPIGIRSLDRPEKLRTEREGIREWIKKQKEHHHTDHHVKLKYHWLEQYEAATHEEFENLLAERSQE